MTDRPFASPVGERLSEYVALRRSLGYDLRTQVGVLRRFDGALLREMRRPGPVTRRMVESFLRSLSGCRPITRRVRLSTIRQFLIYLSQFEARTFIPDRFLEPARGSPRPPHIYTADEIQALLHEALHFRVRNGGRPWLVYHTLIGFLYATGMRISEALALTLADLDIRRAVVVIRKTKFHKSRYVPVTLSTVDAMKRYLVARAARGCSTAPNAPLFVTGSGGRLPYDTARGAFEKIARRAKVRGAAGSRRPRLHDLRHTAAVTRLSMWYREGKDVQALLPVLVTYLGHSAVHCTEIYLTTTPELLAAASERFENYIRLDGNRDGDRP